MSGKIVKLYKKTGQTPLECINEFKKSSRLQGLPITYAGRLDPLAEGVLLALVGDKCLDKDKYLSLSKEYEVSILFGFTTDSYDFMGKITNQKEIKNFDFSRVEEILPKFIGQINQKYPIFSSRTVLGKPLHVWAREEKLTEIEIPTHKVEIKNIEIINTLKITNKEFLQKVKNDINKVSGDFRQSEIIKIWEKALNKKQNEYYPVVNLRVSCGSGTYMRVLANEIGNELGFGALALKIIRTKVGNYSI